MAKRFPQQRYCFWKFPSVTTFPGKSDVQLKMTVEYWQGEADGGKQKYSEKTLSWCHFVQYKSYGLTQDRTRASVLKSRRLTAWDRQGAFRDWNESILILYITMPRVPDREHSMLPLQRPAD